MAISGSDKALMFAQSGVMRSGASRSSYHSSRVFVSVGGTQRSSGRTILAENVYESLSITQTMNETPDSCTFKARGFQPVDGQEVIVTLGSSNTLDRLFAGIIMQDTHGYDGTPANGNDSVTVTDYTWFFTRTHISGQYTNTSATDIAEAIVATVSGFTTNNIASDLPTLDEFTYTNVTPLAALTRLAKRIGADLDVDYHKDVHFTITDTSETAPVALTSSHRSLDGFTVSRDMSQVITRALQEGGGSNVVTGVDAGETILPITDIVWYNAGGGQVACGPQRLTYGGIQTGGSGTLVGPGVSPAAVMTGTPQTGGVGAGPSFAVYEVTFVTGAGESLPSPLLIVLNMGPIVEPTPTMTLGGPSVGAGPDAGAHTYAVSFVDGAAGETLAGIDAGSITTRDVPAPTVVPIVTQTEANGCIIGASGDSYDFAYLYVSGLVSGTTTLGTSAGAQTAGACSSGGGRKDFRVSVTASTDPAVTQIWIYVNKNGGGWKFQQALGNVSTSVYIGAIAYAGAAAPGANTAYVHAVSLGNVPIGQTGTVSRNIYRTVANAAATYANLKLVATIADNTTDSFTDTVPDASLGAAAPGSNTTDLDKVALAHIPIGGTGTTDRYIYRSSFPPGGVPLRIITMGDNTTTTASDDFSVAGAIAAPGSDTSGLTQPTGQVLAGATSMPVAGTGPFSSSGGWVIIGNGQQVVRYTGISGTNLTGIPSTGAGAITATVAYNSTASAAAALTDIPASGDGSILYAIKSGEPANLVVQVDDADAQAVIATVIGNGDDGVIEDYQQDGTIGETEARARAVATLALNSAIYESIRWSSRDKNTRAGRSVSVSLPYPTSVNDTFKIQSVTISNFTPALMPTFSANGSDRRFTFEDLLRRVKG